MMALIITVHVVVCFVLILVILLQAGRGAGLSWGSFGGNPQSIFGTKSASFLKKATSVSAILFLVTCISLNIIEAKKSKSLFAGPKNTKIDIEKIKKALEQVKTEETKKTQTSTTAPGTTAGTPSAAAPVASTTTTPPAAETKSAK